MTLDELESIDRVNCREFRSIIDSILQMLRACTVILSLTLSARGSEVDRRQTLTSKVDPRTVKYVKLKH